MTPKDDADVNGLYKKTTLKNGLRVVTEKVPSVRSVTMGVWIDVGSRFENDQEAGVTHLIEHMLFKGTRRRTAKQIASALESVGGGLNAFTSREQTCYTARIPAPHLATAIDVLADLTCHATLTPTNLKREKMVVLEEIKESLENPSDHIFDLFAESFWKGHALGKPILGSAESVYTMPRSRIKKYIERYYRSGSIVIAASGAVSHAKLVKLVKDKFSFVEGSAGIAEAAAPDAGGNTLVKRNKNQQVHAIVGYPGVAWSDPRKMAVITLSTYLGGGMSSVLFQKVREDRGLAYTVYTYHDVYRDAGIFGTYLATDKDRLPEALAVINKQFDQVRSKKISPARLTQVKEQLKGQMMLSLESTAAKMNRMARFELMEGRYVGLSKSIDVVDSITAEQVRDVARHVFDPERRSVVVLGPGDRKRVEDALNG